VFDIMDVEESMLDIALAFRSYSVGRTIGVGVGVGCCGAGLENVNERTPFPSRTKAGHELGGSEVAAAAAESAVPVPGEGGW
jgi:hypothetical protein